MPLRRPIAPFRTSLTLCAALFILTAPGAQASRYTGVFFHQYAADSYPSSPPDLAIGDLNSDGIPDVTAPGPGGIYVMLGRGDGTLGSPLILNAGQTYTAIGDFDGDGHADIAYASNASAGALFGNGTGTVWSSKVTRPGSHAGAAAADFDGDGVTDFATIDGIGYQSGILTFLSRPGRTFAVVRSPQDSALSFPVSMQVADMNRDGHPDLVIAQRYGELDEFLGNGDGTFTARTVASVDWDSWGLGIADLTGDGLLDLIFPRGFSLTIFPGLGDGTYGTQIYRWWPEPRFYGLAAGDVTNDGVPDVVVSHVNGSDYAIEVRAGSADGNLAPPIVTPSGLQLYPLHLADMNGDENLDIVALSEGEKGVLVSLGDGAGHFGRGTVDLPLSGQGLRPRAADMDGDSLPDLAAVVTGNRIELWRNLGNRQFVLGSTTTVPSGNSWPNPWLFDFDRDGVRDMLVDVTTDIMFFRGLGDGTFGAGLSTGVANAPGAAIEFADMNGDSIADLVTTSGGNLRFYPGTPGATFGPAIDTPLSQRPGPIAVGDLNGDGVLDVAIGATTQCPYPPCPTDYWLLHAYGSGNGTFSPAAALHMPRMIRAVHVEDIDANGRADLVAFDAGNGLDPASVLVRFQQTDGLLGSLVDSPWPYSASSAFSMCDITRDGLPDALYRNASGFSLSVGNGQGQFTPETGYESRNPSEATASDLDLDGWIDIVQTSSSRNVLGISFGHDPAPPTLAILSPSAGAPLGFGFPATIEWQAQSPNGIEKVDLFVSRHGVGGPYSSVVKDRPAAGTHEWLVTGPPTDSLVIKAVAHDPFGTVGVARSALLQVRDLVGAPLPPSNKLALTRIAPNPSRSSVAVDYVTPLPGRARMDLLDVQGRTAAILFDEERPAGVGSVRWRIPAGRIQAGLYFLRLTSGGQEIVDRLVVIP